jgi:hypothetical protein
MATHASQAGHTRGQIYDARVSLLFLLLFIGVTAQPAALHAQRVVGTVLEDRSRTPVADAQVALVDNTGTTRSIISTDSSGGFALSAPAGRYTIHVLRLGYQTYNSPVIELAAGETVTVKIRLGVGAVPLDPIRVSARSGAARGGIAEFYNRRDNPARSGGYFISRKDLDRNPTTRTTTLLMRVPNVELVPLARGTFDTERYFIRFRGGANSTGSCSPAIYLNGVRIQQNESVTVDEYIDPSQLEGVEVYNRTASAPLQYTNNNDCGVVAFWTRIAEPGGEGDWKRLAVGFALVGGFIVLLIR